MKISQLTIRALILSALGSIIISASSIFVALRMSALPWPTVFVAVLSLASLKVLGKTNINEINIAQTGMSAGAMIAGGIAFTLPGLWITGIYQVYDPAKESLSQWLLPKFLPVFALSLAAAILGSIISWFSRKKYILEEKLAYPIGRAAVDTLIAGEQGGSQARFLFSSLGLAAIFTVLRDQAFGSKPLIPAVLSTKIKSLPLDLNLSPMSLAIGYMIGLPASLYWLIGALISHWLIQVYGQSSFDSPAAMSSFILTAAVGLMLGSGFAIVFQMIKGIKLKRSQTSFKYKNKFGLILLISTALGYSLTVIAGLSPLVALLSLLGLILVCSMAAVITGQTGINPMEIFGILVLLAIRLFIPVSNYHAFLVTALVAICCGYAGDLLNDYKMGAVLKTNPKAQLVSQIVGALVGSLVASLSLFAIIYKYGGVGGDTGLSSAQAFSVSSLIQGLGDPLVFSLAVIIGFIFYLKEVPAMIIGIGMLLPLAMSTTIFLGAFIKWLIQKSQRSEEKMQVIAAGLLGGEGITGTAIAIISMLKG